jgi:hypothetical protein
MQTPTKDGFQAIIGKSPIDAQHIAIGVAFVAGVAYGAKDLITAAITHQPQNAGGLVTGFVVLAVTAVAAFLKNKPGSWQVAFTEGDQTGESAEPPTTETK